MVFDFLFTLTVGFYNKIYSKLVNKSSYTMLSFFRNLYLLLSAIDIAIDFVFHKGNLTLLLDILSPIIFLVLFALYQKEDEESIQSIALKYQPGTIVLIPAQFPRRIHQFKIRKLFVNWFFVSNIIAFFFLIVELFSTHYYSAWVFFIGSSERLTISFWFLTTFFYAEPTGKTVWARVKEKIDNRQRAVRFSPIGV